MADVILSSKVCTKCNERKLFTEFCKSKSSKDGMNYWCLSLFTFECNHVAKGILYSSIGFKVLPHLIVAIAIMDAGSDFRSMLSANRPIACFSIPDREVTKKFSNGCTIRAVRAKVATQKYCLTEMVSLIGTIVLPRPYVPNALPYFEV